MDNQLISIEEKGEIVLYQPDDNVRLEVRLQDDTVWLTQQQMAELFNTTRNNITLHIGNIFKESELDVNSVRKESLLTALDGKNIGPNFIIWMSLSLLDIVLRAKSVRASVSGQ